MNARNPKVSAYLAESALIFMIVKSGFCAGSMVWKCPLLDPYLSNLKRVKLLDCTLRSTSPDRHGESVRVDKLHRSSRAGLNAFERFPRALMVGRRARTAIILAGVLCAVR